MGNFLTFFLSLNQCWFRLGNFGEEFYAKRNNISRGFLVWVVIVSHRQTRTVEQAHCPDSLKDKNSPFGPHNLYVDNMSGYSAVKKC